MPAGLGRPGVASEPVTLEIIRGAGAAHARKDIIKAELLKRLNVNIELVGYNDISNYINVLNTRIATGAFPDLFWVTRRF